MRPAIFSVALLVARQGVQVVSDVGVEVTAAEFLAGRDPVLARALR